MMTNTGSGRLRTTMAWGLKVAVAGVFLLAAGAKLSGQPMMVEEFGVIGLGQGFRIFTGAVEVAGALLLLWPRAAFLGALVLLGVCAGAFVAQAGPLHGDLIHVVILAILVLGAAWTAHPGGRRAET